MEKCIIVAMADNNAIGRAGDVPWHISEDLRYFRKVTSGYPVIMGRRTYESIGRPLPGRRNIVVSGRGQAPAGTDLASGLEEAFRIAADAPGNVPDRVFVIGGGQIYAAAVGEADTLYVTHVRTVVSDADTFFPAISPEVWEKCSCSELKTDPESGLHFEFAVYRKK